MKKYYTEGAALQVINDLVTVAQGRRDDFDFPHGFITEHPWTAKYLGPYAEADDFLHIVNDKSVAISVIPMTEREKSYRTMQKMQSVLRVSVKAPSESPLRIHEQIFTFEQQPDGTYCCMNG